MVVKKLEIDDLTNFIRSDDDTDDDEDYDDEQRKEDVSLWSETSHWKNNRKFPEQSSSLFHRLEAAAENVSEDCPGPGETLRGRINLLSNEAAKHKIAVRPRRNHPRSHNKSNQPRHLVTSSSEMQENKILQASNISIGKRPARKTEEPKAKTENVKNLGFFSRLLKGKTRSSKEPLEKCDAMRDSTLSDLASVNVRSLKLDSGSGAALRVMLTLIMKYCLFRLLSVPVW